MFSLFAVLTVATGSIHLRSGEDTDTYNTVNYDDNHMTVSDFWKSATNIFETYNSASDAVVEEVYYGCTTPGLKVAECDYNGVCTATGGCHCDDGYVTHDSPTVGCNYKQKSRVIAFLLSFFLGIEGGAGEWYLGNEELALAQLLTTWVGLIGIAILMCALSCAFGEGGQAIAILYVPWVLCVLIWWMCDWILIIKGDMKDGNGVETYNNF